ncbi:hypothetical protein [Microbulbifer variabilis]|uniref:hypothetical protein n=1 Tax=Microbulbifer variabilis TaxID=266805 RepID=UPI001CFC65FD|nr:hypothetical protein [Microbulbifer variabilis]
MLLLNIDSLIWATALQLLEMGGESPEYKSNLATNLCRLQLNTGRPLTLKHGIQAKKKLFDSNQL